MQETEEKFYELSDDVIEAFNKVVKEKAFPMDLKFQFVGSSKLKTMVKLKKVSDPYSFLLDKEILVLVNEDYYDKYDEKVITILFEQEVDRIEYNLEKGTIKIGNLSLVTNPALISKYGYEEVARANQVDELLTQQIEDGREESFVS